MVAAERINPPPEFLTQKIPIYDYDLDKWVRTRTRTRNQPIFSGKSPDTRTHLTRFFRFNRPIPNTIYPIFSGKLPYNLIQIIRKKPLNCQLKMRISI